MVTASFWRDRRVFITGHTGFKGSWLSLWLQQMGANVTGYALAPPTQPSLFEEAGVADGMTSLIADVRNLDTLSAAIDEHRPEVVFHLAAQPLVRYSYDAPVETYATNVMGTVHLLEAVRKQGGVRAVVNVTSDKCYENHERMTGYREDEAMGGYDPYSNSKGCSELVTAAYRQSFFNPADYRNHRTALASARAGNVIGGGDWAEDRLIPDLMRAWEAGLSAPIRNPNAIRPWQHVLDPLSGYLRLAERLWEDGPAYAGAWNFGPAAADEVTVETLVTTLSEKWAGPSKWTTDDDDHPHEATYLKLDCGKAREKLGWRPHWTLNDALAAVADWYGAHRDRADLKKKTVEQIARYMQPSAHAAWEVS
ncbi:MAG: CDP-glucose 4,6-dehydratase [Leptospirillia bacterium]